MSGADAGGNRTRVADSVLRMADPVRTARYLGGRHGARYGFLVFEAHYVGHLQLFRLEPHLAETAGEVVAEPEVQRDVILYPRHL